MGFHTFDPEKAAKLEDTGRYRYVSREELLSYLDLADGETVADLGSGTGFYTDDVASFGEGIGVSVYAVDVQDAMHEEYRAKGVPENVSLVTADVGDLPFDENELDAAFSTMTFHEFADEDALAEVARVLGSGGRLVVADWSGAGRGEDGPSVDERYDLEAATELVESAGFEVRYGKERAETFVFVARR
ncbi:MULTISPECIES: class I SAM-dependent methyltransferase [unclassified Haladaptatus]|uniref:class I SAM-dependent methyltransferase n=1 Tax=unclassified Haladaptatus TaxID=2622732 RepID=UPI00209C1328|nr:MULTISPECIES: class I SAM-dependent methyltransferase [unclassified Haladaptatus]MCO8246326.1 class I SAM-dependent methyltransferase [Haladaptatus sp. AB643]MCO8255229.1 class I SAM-dependent methyltransferase [Haladaptatus sp. AB618]